MVRESLLLLGCQTSIYNIHVHIVEDEIVIIKARMAERYSP